MKVDQFRQGHDNWGYLIIENDSCLIVDPLDSSLYETRIKRAGLQPKAILLTHYHGDHTAGVPALKRQFNLPVIGPADGGDTPGFVSERAHPSQEFNIPPFEFIAHALPGHSATLAAYYFPRQNWLFAGDLLFNLGCGRVLEGTHAALYASLQRIKDFPVNTEIFVGHDYRKTNLDFAKAIDPNFYAPLHAEDLDPSTTLEMELWWNPFLRASTFDEWKQLRDRRDNF